MIDAMTLFEVEAIYGYWQDHPPTHLLLAALFNVKPPQRPQSNGIDGSAVTSILAVPGMKQGAGGKDLKSAELDFEELKRSYQGQGQNG